MCHMIVLVCMPCCARMRSQRYANISKDSVYNRMRCVSLLLNRHTNTDTQRLCGIRKRRGCFVCPLAFWQLNQNNFSSILAATTTTAHIHVVPYLCMRKAWSMFPHIRTSNVRSVSLSLFHLLTLPQCNRASWTYQLSSCCSHTADRQYPHGQNSAVLDYW